MRPLGEDACRPGSLEEPTEALICLEAGVPPVWDRSLQPVIAVLPSGGSAAMLVMCQHPVL
ncbi:hypothetical protein C8R21_11342 [Nitrosospira multiformis]|uniref:Uncharacterized protein n=1 Tax=Nitrosospira multiformis TaxID=1231 RepID=A0A2T5IAJ2_9PROT|nr:hypothetical protein C8R21_11342 [Nitrosospira multiformis]